VKDGIELPQGVPLDRSSEGPLVLTFEET